MLEIKSCLKISFKGEEVFIICEPGFSYNEIIAQACARFEIPETQRAGVVLTNGQGYVFEQQLLEYFLLLFPCPEQVFYLRLDWQKLRRSVVEPVKPQRLASDEIPEKQQKPQTSSNTETESEYVAVPVHRQNCFIGALPTNNSVHRQACLMHVQQQPQQQRTATAVLRRLRPEEADSVARSRLKSKRIRFQVYNGPRRTAAAPAAAAQMSLLTTAPRSMRI